MHAKMRISYWNEYEIYLDNLINSFKKKNKTITPFPFLSLIDNPEYHKTNAEIYSKEQFIGPKKEQLERKIIKIRIFFSRFSRSSYFTSY